MIQASGLIGGRYQLETPIPVTGPWEAWQAVDLIQGRPVAVRLLRAEQAAQPQDIERFRTTASLATKVSHPCVAQVFDYGELDAGQTPYLVAELVDAPSLAGLAAVGPLEPPKAMDIVARAASGLHAAHAAGLAHGNLTPDCLLVSPDGQVKITDFVTGSWAEAEPAYLAPERAAAAPGTPASDLYSLGVVGYECMLGTPAFSRKAVKLAADPGRHLPPLPRSVPAAVAGLIDDLTAPDPAKRPASAERVSVRAGLLRDAPAKDRDAQAKSPVRRRNRRSHEAPAPVPPPDDGAACAPVPQDAPTPAPAPYDAPTPTPAPYDALTPAPTLAEGHTAILSVPPQAPPPGVAPDRRRSWWPLLVAGIGALLAAGLVGWLLATAFTGSSPQHDPSGSGASAITLQPSGRVPAGSVVTVTAARRPPGQRPSGRG